MVQNLRTLLAFSLVSIALVSSTASCQHGLRTCTHSFWGWAHSWRLLSLLLLLLRHRREVLLLLIDLLMLLLLLLNGVLNCRSESLRSWACSSWAHNRLRTSLTTIRDMGKGIVLNCIQLLLHMLLDLRLRYWLGLNLCLLHLDLIWHRILVHSWSGHRLRSWQSWRRSSCCLIAWTTC